MHWLRCKNAFYHLKMLSVAPSPSLGTHVVLQRPLQVPSPQLRLLSPSLSAHLGGRARPFHRWGDRGSERRRLHWDLRVSRGLRAPARARLGLQGLGSDPSRLGTAV